MSPGLRGIFSRSAVLCALVIGLADLLVVVSRTSWIGLLGYTPEWANAGLYMACPLMAGASAFITRIYFASETVAISGARSAGGALRTVSAAWARVLTVAVTAHAAVMVTAIAVTIGFGPSGTLTWEPFVYALLPIAIACAIGTALAAVIPHLWASILAVLATYGVWYLAATTGSITPVNIGGATISLAGLAYRQQVVLASVIAAAAVIVLFLGVAVLAVRLQGFKPALTAFAAVTIVVVVVGAASGARVGTDRFTAADSVEYVCAGSQPRLCVTVAHSTRVHAIAHNVDLAAQSLANAGVDMSGVVLREAVGGGHPSKDGDLLLTFGQLNGINVQASDYAQSLLRPTNCKEYFAAEMTPGLDRLLAAEQLVSEWMDAKADGAKRRIADKQVRQLYHGLRMCSVDDQLRKSVEPR